MLQRVHDLLKTSTAEFKKKVPSPTNGNGQARNGGNGHHHRARHQIHHGYRERRKAFKSALLRGYALHLQGTPLGPESSSGPDE